MSAIIKADAPSDTGFPELQSADENTVYEVMQAFLKEAIAVNKAELVIIRGQDNRVSMPQPPMIMLQIINQRVLSLNESRYTDCHKIVHSVKEIQIQLDFYGSEKVPAQKMADMVMTIFNDDWASQFFNQHTKVIHPLYVNASHNTPFISGEDAYNDRYTVFAYCSYQPEIGIYQQSAKEIKLQMENI